MCKYHQSIHKTFLCPWVVWCSWLEHPPITRGLWVLIPSQGTFVGCGPILSPGASRFLSLPSSLSKSNGNKCPWVRKYIHTHIHTYIFMPPKVPLYLFGVNCYPLLQPKETRITSPFQDVYPRSHLQYPFCHVRSGGFRPWTSWGGGGDGGHYSAYHTWCMTFMDLGNSFYFLFLIHFIDYTITVVPFSLYSPVPAPPSHQHSPPLVHVHGSYI